MVAIVLLPVTLTLAAQEWTADQQAVIAVMEQWQKAWDSGDAATVEKLLTDELDFTSGALKGTFKTKPDLLKAYAHFQMSQRESGQSSSNKVAFTEVKLAGDDATVTRKIEWLITGRKTMSGTVTRTAQLTRINREWKLRGEK
jgi:ketosteroid isomerase-like protein